MQEFLYSWLQVKIRLSQYTKPLPRFGNKQFEHRSVKMWDAIKLNNKEKNKEMKKKEATERGIDDDHQSWSFVILSNVQLVTFIIIAMKEASSNAQINTPFRIK